MTRFISGSIGVSPVRTGGTPMRPGVSGEWSCPAPGALE
ncbi:hypothetical protein RAS1_15240 [Phycisphaerae bacterium RAS1]|nr:hypothetical protein RAS1_15240 [Phycisphaerae bacterium RAS1]